jgi:hypothetical protein
MTDERLMRYARAIAQDDIDNSLGPGNELPDLDNDLWDVWRQRAVVVMRIADEEYQTPAPGDNRAKLPDHILAMLPHQDYDSTACESARRVHAAIDRQPDHIEELLGWSAHLHKWCRLNHKFEGTRCVCACHNKAIS